ncbi:UNVERIFIED_CONTAM: hypothetical protein GTU68_036142 [Idotea baltica]|nr:hypothetical protein [Idotea baltica]
MLLIAGLWVGPGSYPDRWRLDDRTIVQEQSNNDKKEQIKKIQAELDDASSSKEALEERARSELGMTKKGETFFEVIMQAEPENPSQQLVEDKNDSTSIEKNSTSSD